MPRRRSHRSARRRLPRPAPRVAQLLKTLPNSPGVYRMLDASGAVIYVGKARNLKARVSNYARLGGHTNRIARMIAATAGMEFVTVNTEAEALLLEANLIKRFRPRFNVLLRDDKSFPYILIARDHRARRSSSIAARARARASTSAHSPRPARSTARSTCCSVPSCCAPVPTACSRAARGRACSTRSSAARPPARARSRSTSTAGSSTRPCASCAARARTCARCTSG